MREKYLGLIIGIIFVAVTIVISLALPKANALQYLTVLLMGIATVYLGFTFSNAGRKQDIIIEIANITLYIVLVLLSLVDYAILSCRRLFLAWSMGYHPP